MSIHNCISIFDRILIFCVLLFLIGMTSSAFGQVSQDISISGSANPVGSGARALGMGGAFIGVADDATAASWNPGGLIQLETPEISAVLSFEKRTEKRTFIQKPEASKSHSIDLADINYLSAAYPFTLKNLNMILSINYQTLYDFNKEVEATYQVNPASPYLPAGTKTANKKIDGYLKALSPAYAIQITPDFSVGITFNWFSDNLESKWKTTYTEHFEGTHLSAFFSQDVFDEEEYRFNGFNLNLGVMWNINSTLTVGAVYKTPFDADIYYRKAYQVTGTIQNTPTTVIADEYQTVRMPPSYGIGLAWRFSDTFTADLDFYRTDWQRYVITQADGRKISPFNGEEISETDTQPTHQIRIGGEYLVIRKGVVIPIRAGVFYDPEPTTHNPDDFYGVSIGSGIAKGRIVFDIAYQYRWGNNVRTVKLGQEEVGQDVKQHVGYMSLICHF